MPLLFNDSSSSKKSGSAYNSSADMQSIYNIYNMSFFYSNGRCVRVLCHINRDIQANGDGSLTRKTGEAQDRAHDTLFIRRVA